MIRKNLAILIFPDVEVLDFAGPFEVFSVTDELNGHELINVYTIANSDNVIVARNGLKVVPDFTLADHPKPDFLLIPGGFGTRSVIDDQEVMEWVRTVSVDCEKVLSVCSGSLILAQAGLLTALKATTHHEVFEELAKLDPTTEIIENKRFVDNGRIITSGGISAGIDMSLYVVGQVFGDLIARKTARYMEYAYQSTATGI